MNGVSYTGLMSELSFPHGVNHTINIIPSKFEYGSEEVYEMF